jgi:hypothetical protein
MIFVDSWCAAGVVDPDRYATKPFCDRANWNSPPFRPDGAARAEPGSPRNASHDSECRAELNDNAGRGSCARSVASQLLRLFQFAQGEGAHRDPDERDGRKDQLVIDEKIDGQRDSEHQQEAPVPTPSARSSHRPSHRPPRTPATLPVRNGRFGSWCTAGDPRPCSTYGLLTGHIGLIGLGFRRRYGSGFTGNGHTIAPPATGD